MTLVDGSYNSSQQSSVDLVPQSLADSSFTTKLTDKDEASPVEQKPTSVDELQNAALQSSINQPDRIDVSESDSRKTETFGSTSLNNSFGEEFPEHYSVSDVPHVVEHLPNGTSGASLNAIASHGYDGDMPKLISFDSTLPNDPSNPNVSHSTPMAVSSEDHTTLVLDKNLKVVASPGLHPDSKSLDESETPSNRSRSDTNISDHYVVQVIPNEANTLEPNMTAEEECGINISLATTQPESTGEVASIGHMAPQQASGEQPLSESFIAMETSRLDPFSSPVQEESPTAKALIAGPKVLRETDT